MQEISARAGGRLFLRQISWRIGLEEQWAVLGTNGSGKTLLANLLCGLHPASSGSIYYAEGINPQQDFITVSIEQQDALCASDQRHDISEYAESATDPGTLVSDLILASSAPDARFALIARQLAIEHLLAKGVRNLSSGEFRKCLLAMGLWRRPALLVLDDPLDALDLDIRQPFLHLLRDQMHSGQQVLMLARRTDALLDEFTHVLVLDSGRVAAAGRKTDAGVQRAIRDLPRAARRSRLPVPGAVARADAKQTSLVELRNVDCSYGETKVLHAASFTVLPAQHTCLVGPNGAGKSTLLSLICGDNSRAYGQDIRVFGELRGAGSSIWELKRRIGMVSNALHRRYPGRCKVLDVLLSGYHDSLGLYEDVSAEEKRHALTWLHSLELTEQQHARFKSLSLGDQRLLLIARAVIKAPPLLILDEPCAGLDRSRQDQALALIDQIAAQQISTILYVSHELDARPGCIKQTLVLKPAYGGGFTVA